jgi:hypothetical protein
VSEDRRADRHIDRRAAVKPDDQAKEKKFATEMQDPARHIVRCAGNHLEILPAGHLDSPASSVVTMAST